MDTPLPPTKPQFPPQSHPMSKQLKVLLFSILIIFLSSVGFLLFRNSAFSKLAPSNNPQTSTSPSNTSLVQTSPSAQTNPSSKLNPQMSLKVFVESTESGKIKGSLKITNSSDNAYGDLYYNITLKEPDIVKHLKTSTGVPVTLAIGGVIPISSIEADIPPIQSHQTEDVSFELPYSSHLPKADYGISADVYTKPSVPLGHTVGSSVAINGSNDYLLFKDCVVVMDSINYGLTEAPISSPEHPAVGQCDIQNPNSKTVTVKYRTDYAIRHVDNYPESQKLSQTSDTLLTFSPGQIKKVTFPLPSVSMPQVYEAKITLVDTEGQNQSFPMLFRWTIKGSSSYIENITLDKDFYSKGEIAQIAISAYASMDLYWRTASGSAQTNIGTVLQNPQIRLSLVDKNQNLCGQITQTLPKADNINSWGNLQLKAPIQTDCINPIAKATILNGNQELATLNKQFLTSNISLSKLGSTTPSSPKKPVILISVILGVALVVITFFIYKKKSGGRLTILIFLLSVLALGYFFEPKIVRAVTNVGPGNAIYYSDVFIRLGGYFTVNSQDSTSVSFHTYQDGSSSSCGNEYAYMLINVSTNLGSVSLPTPNYGDAYPPTGYTRDYWGGNNGTIANVWPGNWVQKDHEDYTFSFGGQLTSVNATFDLGKATYHGYGTCGNNDRNFCGFGNWSDSSTNDAGPQIGYYSWNKPCLSPDPSTVCSGQPYNDSFGNSCTGTQASVCDGSNTCQGQTTSGTCGSTCAGTKVCDITAPSVTLLNPPVDTCYKGPTGTNGTPFSNTQPIQLRVDDTRNGTVTSSGISNVNVKVTSITSNTVTKTINGTLASGATNNGTYSVTIPQDSTTFPTNGGRYSITAYATDNASHTSNSPSSSFTYDATGTACVAPHIQTQNGDVHSQQGVGQ